jgi:hypothetical protein
VVRVVWEPEGSTLAGSTPAATAFPEPEGLADAFFRLGGSPVTRQLMPTFAVASGRSSSARENDRVSYSGTCALAVVASPVIPPRAVAFSSQPSISGRRWARGQPRSIG